MARFTDRLKLLDKLSRALQQFFLLFTLYLSALLGYIRYILLMNFGTEIWIILTLFSVGGWYIGKFLGYIIDLHHRSYDVVSEYIEKTLNKQYDV